MSLVFFDQPPTSQRGKESKIEVGQIVQSLKVQPGKWAKVQSDTRSPELWIKALKAHTGIVTKVTNGKEAKRLDGNGTRRLHDIWASYQS